MKTAQKIAVAIAIAAVIGGAAYIGGWIMFIGGIVSIVEAVNETPIQGLGIATGILRFVFAWPVFILSVVGGSFIVSQFWPKRARF